MIDDDLARRLVVAARKGRDWIQRRDSLIVEAIEAGASQREVAKLVGLTQPAVHAIYHRSP